MSTSASDFRNKWGRVKKECRGLSRFTSALNKNFERRLTKILGNIEECLEEAKKEHQGEVLSHLRTFAAVVGADLEGIKAARRMVKRLDEAEKEFRRLSSELRDFESKAYEACAKYFEKREEYVRAKRRVIEKAEKNLDTLRSDFVERASEVTKGYEIMHSGMSTTPEDLFEDLVRGNEGRVELKRKGGGLLGSIGEEALVKSEVLDYLIKETRSRLIPVLRDRDESVQEVETLYPEIKGLEKACMEAEELREQAMKPLEELRREIIDIRKSGAYAYTLEEKLQEIMENYWKKIEEIDKALG